MLMHMKASILMYCSRVGERERERDGHVPALVRDIKTHVLFAFAVFDLPNVYQILAVNTFSFQVKFSP